MQIKLNDLKWHINFVAPNDERLFINGQSELGAMYYEEQTIYIVANLPLDIFMRVFTHEITHAVIWSYLLTPPVKFTEEDVCNLVAQYFNEIATAREMVMDLIRSTGAEKEKEKEAK